MSSEGLSETAEEAHPDNIAQRPASNLLLADFVEKLGVLNR